MKRIVLVLALMLVSVGGAWAAPLTFSPLFSSDMILQRGIRVPVFGCANPGERVTVTFGDRAATAQAGNDGRWKAYLAPMPPSEQPQTLAVSSVDDPSRTVSAANVLVGDVWICSGQSNMERTISSFSVLAPALKDVVDPNVRLFSLRPAIRSDTPRETPIIDMYPPDNRWHMAQGKALMNMSPAAFFFGRKLESDTGVPVGLILSATGGSMVEAWLPPDFCAAHRDQIPEGETFAGCPGASLYNGMIAPLTSFAIKGFIWYQGESNASFADRYASLFSALITGWRSAWGEGDIPFLYVQLPGFRPGDIYGEAWAWLREAQQQALSLKKTGMAVTTDLGEYSDIHPQNKQPVGERLALLAEMLDGRRVDALAPVYRRSDIHGDHIVAWFDHAAGGLITKRVALNKAAGLPPGEDPDAFVVPSDKVAGFTICGADGKFVPAEAEIHGDSVSVRTDLVRHPVAVRYAWSGFPLCNVFSQGGLPLAPFRTDHFPMPLFSGPLVASAPFTSAADLGVPLRILPSTGESKNVDVTVAGLTAYRTAKISAGQGRFMYADVDDSAFKNGATSHVVFTLVYYDEDPGTILVLYDSSDPAVHGANGAGSWKPLGRVTSGGTSTWRKVEFEVSDALLSRRLNGADMRIQWSEDVDRAIAGLYVRAAK
ncbi:MAG: sialate O-acetylesterase [Capsulimonadaceae bacterium]|nr:sialate O-acetylesterase [Capsulimonadaceae bacterium]